MTWEAIVTKQDIIRNTTFGQQIAEDESGVLDNYFVETDQWQRIYAGDIDVIYGAKGMGKSAIYSLLIARTNQLFDRGVLIAPAENPRGTPVFQGLVGDPPTSEEEFHNLWKLYFLSLVGKVLREYDLQGEAAQRVVNSLEEAQLVQAENTLPAILRATIDYVRRFLSAESIEGGIKLDPMTGLIAGVTGKITFREPSVDQTKAGLVSIDKLMHLANEALGALGLHIWILLDRLDVAFTESEELEANALRSLFRSYLDFIVFDNISLKIFLRSDIWRRITAGGFREASHITRQITISWNKDALLNLIMRRLLQNKSILDYYAADKEAVLRSVEKQAQFFYRVYPARVNVGLKKPTTLDWMLSRTKDGLGQNAPRELIHLLSSTRETQLRRLELGNTEPPAELLFEGIALREALPAISETRLKQTLYAEYPNLQPYLEKLEGAKTEQSPQTLAEIWSTGPSDALAVANLLKDVGFFERKVEDNRGVSYWVPFLYRPALHMVQGTAIADQDDLE
jgi:hypothetical protein